MLRLALTSTFCKRFLYVSILAGINPLSLATTYYVALEGDDTATGGADSQWRTIQKAADAVVAGDIVLVADGGYPENVIARSNGSETAPIAFRGASANAVVSSFSVSGAHTIIEGFTISGAGVADYQGSVSARKGAQSLKIRRNTFKSSPAKVYQIVTTGSPYPSDIVVQENQFLDGNFHAIALYGSGHQVVGNLFTSQNGWDALRLLSSNTRITKNSFQNWSNRVGNLNHPDLIQSFSNNGEKAENNVIEGNTFKNCIGTQIGHIQDQSGANVRNWVWRNNIWENVEWAMSMYAAGMEFYNNVFYRSGQNTDAPLLFRTDSWKGSATNARVYNNIFFECGRRPADPQSGWYLVEPAVVGFEANNNLVIGRDAGVTKTGFKVGALESDGINGLSPLFVNAGASDFSVRVGSPCVRAGRNFGAVFTTDILGTVRGDQWDIGAYQRIGPQPPTQLRVVPPR